MITSAHTCVRKIPALARKVDDFFGWKSGSKNLDIGAGKYDDFTEYLKKKHVNNLPFDPYNRSEKSNRDSLGMCPADTVTLSDVLNVIPAEVDRIRILRLAKAKCRKGGRVYITVYEGDKSGDGRMSKTDCWQEHRRICSYFPEVEQVFDFAIHVNGVIVCFNV